MFSDDEDFLDDVLDVNDSPQSTSKTSDSDEFHDLIQKRVQLEKRMNDVDELARQVKFAVELQKGMADCYSNRVAMFPIETDLELQSLTSGSLLLLLSIRNKTSYNLVDWSLSASFSPTLPDGSGVGSFSQSATLDSLAPDEEFSSELFVAQHHLHLPMIVHLHLIKCFYVDGQQKYILIELDHGYLSLRDLVCSANLTLPTSVNEGRTAVSGSFTLRVPRTLVDLLSGCPDDNDPVNVLRILLPKHQFRSLALGTTSANAILVKDSFHKYPLQIAISKEKTYFVVNITLKDGTLRNRLRESLQLYLIHLSLRVLKRPSNSISIVSEGRTVEEIFNNVISAFVE